MFDIASIEERINLFLEESNGDLPVFDRTALLVHEEASSGDPDPDKIIALIAQDQILVAEVLKVANSSFFQGIRKVSRIHDAIVRIGLREIVNCVMMAAQRKIYNSRHPFVQQYTTTLWQHSVTCAYGAQWLARHTGYEDLAPEAFIGGLLHDVGKLLVLRALVSVSEKSKNAPKITKIAADEFLDTLHPQTGALLLEKWNLPEQYCVVCRDHHCAQYDKADILLLLIRLANLVCTKIGVGIPQKDDVELLTCPEAGLLGLSDITLAELEIAMEDYAAQVES